MYGENTGNEQKKECGLYEGTSVVINGVTKYNSSDRIARNETDIRVLGEG